MSVVLLPAGTAAGQQAPRASAKQGAPPSRLIIMAGLGHSQIATNGSGSGAPSWAYDQRVPGTYMLNFPGWMAQHGPQLDYDGAVIDNSIPVSPLELTSAKGNQYAPLGLSLGHQLKLYVGAGADIAVAQQQSSGAWLDQLSKGGGSGRYERLFEMIDRLITWGQSQGYTDIEVHHYLALGWRYDSGGQTWEQLLTSHLASFTADVKARTGQSDVYMFHDLSENYEDEHRTVAWFEAEPHAILVGTRYNLQYYDGLHLDPYGTLNLGVIYADAIKRSPVFDNTLPAHGNNALRITSAVRSGNNITLSFGGATGSVVFHAGTNGYYNLRFFANGSEFNPTSITRNGDQLVVTDSRVGTAGTLKVRIMRRQGIYSDAHDLDVWGYIRDSRDLDGGIYEANYGTQSYRDLDGSTQTKTFDSARYLDHDEVTVTTGTDTTPPAAPTGLNATPGSGQVQLRWNANGEADLSYYRVHYGTASRSYTTTVTAGNATSYQVSGLTGGQRYYFAVTAVDGSGNASGYSSEVSAVPTANNAAPAFDTPYAFSGQESSTFALTGTVSDADPVTITLVSKPAWVSFTDNGNRSFTLTGTYPAYNTGGGNAYSVVLDASDGVNAAVRQSFTLTVTAAGGGAGGGSLPSPWTAADVGTVGTAGTASHNSGTFTVAGAGNDIWGSQDAFHFVYQSLNGDGEIRARITSQTNTSEYAKAGLMIRESLTPGAANAFIALTPGHGLSFQWRTQSGGQTDVRRVPAGAPVWMRLVRSGATMTAYQSADGQAWTVVSTATVSMAQSVYVGLAVTSHNVSARSTAVFESVQGPAGQATSSRHAISLSQGWNFVSSWVRPQQTAIADVLAPVASQLVLAKDDAGNTYMPAFSINTIGQWEADEGYLVYLDAPATLEVNGTAMAPEATTLPLAAGWNLVPYLRQSPMPVADAFASIGGSLVMVKDQAGRVYLPEFSINDIGNLEAGQAYKVYVDQLASLTYPANGAGKTDAPVAAGRTASPAAASSAVLVVTTAAPQALDGATVVVRTEAGREMGRARVEGGRAHVLLIGDDVMTEETMEGARQDEALSLELLPASASAGTAGADAPTARIARVRDGLTGATLPAPHLRYQADALYVAELDVPDASPARLEGVYPNPSSSPVTVAFRLPAASRVRLELYNVLGQRVAVLLDEVRGGGRHEEVLSVSLPGGTYLLRMLAGDVSQSTALVVL